MFRTIQIDEGLVKMLKHTNRKEQFYYFPTKKSSTQMAHYMPFGSAHFFIISSVLRLASKETTIQYLNQLLQNQSH